MRVTFLKCNIRASLVRKKDLIVLRKLMIDLIMNAVTSPLPRIALIHNLIFTSTYLFYLETSGIFSLPLPALLS